MRRARHINIPRIKANAMFVLGLPFAVLSGLTGLGAQLAAAPMIGFMLGFPPERSAGTAQWYAWFAALAALVAAGAAGVLPSLGAVLLVAVGATIGTLLAGNRFMAVHKGNGARLAQLLLAALAIAVARDVTRPYVGSHAFDLPLLLQHPGLAGFVGGVAAGALANAMQAPIGAFIVPLAVYVLDLHTAQAVLLSLAVQAVAALLPVVSYRARGLVDAQFAWPMALSGALGGALGGYILARAGTELVAFPLVLFGVCTLFLSSWNLSRLS